MPKIIGFRDWERIKSDYCSGEFTSKQLAQKWRVNAGSLRARAAREEWPTPERYKQALDKAVQIATDVVVQGFRNSEEPGSPESMALAGLQPLQSGAGSSLQQDAGASKTIDTLTYQQSMAQFACRQVAAGFGKMKPPANWREMATADTIARRALGLDAKGGGGAAAMIRITGGVMTPMDIAVGVQGAEGPEDYYGEAE